jgi:hypothetical protein
VRNLPSARLQKVIAGALTEEVLLAADKAVESECRMHQALRKETSLKVVYKKYGAF